MSLKEAHQPDHRPVHEHRSTGEALHRCTIARGCFFTEELKGRDSLKSAEVILHLPGVHHPVDRLAVGESVGDPVAP